MAYKKTDLVWIHMYENYVKEYNKTAMKLYAKGDTMLEDQYTLEEFKVEYTAERNDLLEDVEAGKLKSVGSVTQSLVYNQAYEMTAKQARAMREWAQDSDFTDYTDEEMANVANMSIRELKLYGGTVLSKYNEKLKQEHPDWSSAQRAAQISFEFFGSPE